MVTMGCAGLRVIRLKDGERVVDVEPVTGEDEEDTDESGVAELGDAGDVGGDDELVVTGLDDSEGSEPSEPSEE